MLYIKLNWEKNTSRTIAFTWFGMLHKSIFFILFKMFKNDQIGEITQDVSIILLLGKIANYKNVFNDNMKVI